MIIQHDSQKEIDDGKQVGMGPGMGSGGPESPFGLPLLPPPHPPGRSRRHLWILLSIVGVVLLLLINLGAILLIQQGRPQGGSSQAQLTPTTAITATPTPAATATPAITPTPQPTPTPAATATPTPQPTPQPTPPVTKPSYWNGILGTQSGVNHVESVTLGKLIGTAQQQALVTVRYNGPHARLDVSVFTNITTTKPTQIFHLAGLTKGNAKISGYNTVLTMEVDSNSTLNAGKSISALKADLFREFTWSAQKNAFTQVAFSGFFPDLTRYQAELDQASVNKGADQWKYDSAEVASRMAAQFFKWQRSLTTTVLSGGGKNDLAASVRVQEAPVPHAQSDGPYVLITLNRLEGNTDSIWEIVSVSDGTRLQVTQPGPRQTITSPVMIKGKGTAYEGVIGQAIVYDHLYTDIGDAQVIGNGGMGNASFSTQVSYASSFQAGIQEGLIEVYESNAGISNEPYTAVMLKVLLNPVPGVTMGPLACPATASNPAYWNPIVSHPALPKSVDQVSCGNLTGDASLQAVVVAREILGGGSVYRDIFVFDKITAQQPVLLFNISHLLHGQAQISGYSSVMSGEVDESKLKAGTTEADLKVDLFREFQWSEQKGVFEQIVFPGLFPDLTRYQAELDQGSVNQGLNGWKNSPVQVSEALAKTLFGWKNRLVSTIQSGGGTRDVDATVRVQEVLAERGGLVQGPVVSITLTRLEGNTRNIWEVIGVKDSSALTLNNLSARAAVSSPITLTGKGNAFEATIGQARVLDHSYATIGQAPITTGDSSGMGNLPYKVSVSYQSGFTQGAQEGIIEIRQTSPLGDGTVILVKVLLKP